MKGTLYERSNYWFSLFYVLFDAVLNPIHILFIVHYCFYISESGQN